MRSPAVLSLLGCLASTAVATCEHECASAYTIPTCQTDSSSTCLTPAARLRARSWPSLTSRTCDCHPVDCPVESKKCTPGPSLPPQLTPQTIPLVCGKKATSNTVTVTYGACPSDNKKQCLLFQLAGNGLEQPKLQIQTSPLTDHAPGQFKYNKYCSGNSCAVPIETVLANENIPSVETLCSSDTKLYIAVHSGVKGDTCWADGEPIYGGNNDKGKSHQKRTSGLVNFLTNVVGKIVDAVQDIKDKVKNNGKDKANNWATQFSISFDCPTGPETCCCCPSSPPPPPPPPKTCSVEAYGWTDGSTVVTESLTDLGCTSNWGWYQKIPADVVAAVEPRGGLVYTGQFKAGLSGLEVGELRVLKAGSNFFVQMIPENGEYIGRVWVQVSCTDPKEKLGDDCRTPSAYSFDSGCVTREYGVEGWTAFDNYGLLNPGECTDYFYFMVYVTAETVVESTETEFYETCAPYPVCDAV
ncbi:hypothetical protein VTJ49DRAFT_6356 [Mycothermus thermophilus]|uniref:Uncharacterized protein n=1 Tax=Humicola insolens TaxID=85995 RepID=A0ABR3VQB5_HUMIN